MTDHKADSDRIPRPPAPADLEAMRTFIQANTRLERVAGLDFVRGGERRPMQVWQADEITPVWTATEADLERQGLEPPFWAFPWAGGQAVARLILARPDLVAGKRVLDIAAGGGLIGLAAALAGAAEVLANDIDPLCEAAVSLNAEANGVTIGWRGGNLLDAPPPGVDVILAGDIFYQKQMAERFLAWLAAAKAQGTQVYVGDPGRAYAPKGGILPLAEYDISTNLDLEGVSMRRARVWAL
ncbi:50S ribosomal protein L11 methyltransferase [Hyphomonas sp.]|uniref:class I SAM-dependent methyltransferase n=1 Tax=Hyphomonas sp. TaxID=87 RepID=UPI0025BB0E38|nr:50S ribosomal protein L11 methyltransferase [Hyphomonas sp.]MBI1400917.1 methyltransferase [Hyphomonas sp.]